jgi:hypothetical protein
MPTPTTKKLGPPGHQIDVDSYLYDCANVEPEALDEEFIRVPADLAYWNERYAQAHKSHLLAKLDSERTEASLMLEMREKLKAMGGKPTVDEVRANVITDPTYGSARLAEIEAEVERTRLRGLVGALEAKKDMLQSLGAKLRSEMSDPLLRSVRG